MSQEELIEGKNSRYCTKCEELKHFECFNKQKNGKYGLRSRCKSCKKEYRKKKYQANKEEELERNRKWREKNPNYASEYYEENKERKMELRKQWRKDNPEKVKEYNKRSYEKYKEERKKNHREWYHSNKEHCSEYAKKYYEENREQILEQSKQYREENREILIQKYHDNKQWYADYNRERYNNDVEYRILNNVRGRLYKALNGEKQSKRTIELVGCTPKELKQHLEDQFEEGMSWDNQGEWHIDHIIPCSVFDHTCKYQQHVCWHYSNLQPLWAEENLSKGNSIPDLGIEIEYDWIRERGIK